MRATPTLFYLFTYQVVVIAHTDTVHRFIFTHTYLLDYLYKILCITTGLHPGTSVYRHFLAPDGTSLLPHK